MFLPASKLVNALFCSRSPQHPSVPLQASFTKQKGRPFMHMQEDGFSSQPPDALAAPSRAR